MQTSKSCSFSVGRTQGDNARLVAGANPNDWWVHADEFPSAHGIVASENGRFPRKAVKACCLQIKNRSAKLKSIDRLAFVVTKVKHISTTNVPGQVTVHRVLRTVRV